MRVFLLLFSLINAVFYVLIYSYFDKILELLEAVNLSPVMINYIKIGMLLIVGFCIGISVMLVLRLKIKRSLFSFKNLIIIGVFPFICLILSEGSIAGFIINKFFNSSENLKELAFYLFSRQAIWSLWLGFAVGSSIRFSFSRRKYKHISAHISAEKNNRVYYQSVSEPDTGKQDHNQTREY